MSEKSAKRRRDARKALQPRCTRTAGPTIPLDLSLHGTPQQYVLALIKKVPVNTQPPSPKPDIDSLVKLQKAIPGIATNAWRVKKKMLDVETGEPKEDMRRVYRHVEAILDALNDAGVEIIDQCGQTYDTGMALRIVSSEEREGLRHEEIVETLKPTIREHGRILQLGEVVVGIPKTHPPSATIEPLHLDANSDQKGQ